MALRSTRPPLVWPLLTIATLGLGCAGDPSSTDSVDDNNFGTEAGDGDGDPTTGDGDGDPTTTGDGDPAGDGDGDPTTTGDGDGDGDDPTGGPKFDTLATPDSGDEGECDPGSNDAVLTGTVFAPNGTIPVGGALVYVSNDPPEPIPDGVYCAECVELACGVDFVETDIDGSFSLPTNSGTGKYLVVQKGQFMRVTEIEVGVGFADLPDEVVELPGEWNPAAGLYIPRIAIADGSFDRLEDALGKFGLGDTTISNFTETTIAGTESFDLYDNGRNPTTDGFPSQGTMTELVSDPAKLAQYHIIFVPCSSDTHSDSLSPQSIENIRAWVAAGGRWYVSDWSNEFMSAVFPEYQTFYTSGGSGDLGSYDSLATVLDDGLLDWLDALPEPLKDINPLNDESHPTLFQLPQVLTVDNWSGIQYPLPEVLVDDGMGGQVNVGHVPWLEGPGSASPINGANHPLTVTGQYGCGKIQFTSYHTAEFFDYVGLSPQELALIYTILEIGVCQQDLPPPQG